MSQPMPPALQLVVADCTIPARTVAAPHSALLDRYHSAMRTEDSRATIDSLTAILREFASARDCFHDADPWLDHARNILRQHTHSPIPPAVAGLAVVTFQVMNFRNPTREAMDPLVDFLERCLAEPLPESLLLGAGMLLASHHFWSGHGVRTEIIIDRLRVYAKSPGISTPLQISWHLALGYCSACADNDGPRCIAETRTGLALAEAAHWHDLDGRLHAVRAYGALMCNDRATAREALHALRDTNRLRRAWDDANYYWMNGWLHLMEGDTLRAAEYGLEGVKASKRAGALFPTGMSHLYLAAAHMLNNQLDAASENMQRATAIAESIGKSGMLFASRLLEAALAERRGERVRSAHLLHAALKFGREMHLRKLHLIPAPLLAELLSQALEIGIEVDYAQQLVRNARLKPPAERRTAEHWPWAVRIRTLGNWSLATANGLNDAKGKAQKRPLELLKALIAFGGSNVPQDRLADALWPHSEGDAAHHTLEMTVKRLRELLGETDIIRVHDGKITINAQHCWLDVWALEQGLERAADATELARALSLYEGPFLQRESQSWIHAPRTRWSRLYLDGIARLGATLEADGLAADAVEWYHRGLACDPTAEILYGRLMLLYRELGQHAEAVKVYNACRNALQTHLHIEPSPPIQKLHRELTGAIS